MDNIKSEKVIELETQLHQLGIKNCELVQKLAGHNVIKATLKKEQELNTKLGIYNDDLLAKVIGLERVVELLKETLKAVL